MGHKAGTDLKVSWDIGTFEKNMDRGVFVKDLAKGEGSRNLAAG